VGRIDRRDFLLGGAAMAFVGCLGQRKGESRVITKLSQHHGRSPPAAAVGHYHTASDEHLLALLMCGCLIGTAWLACLAP